MPSSIEIETWASGVCGAESPPLAPARKRKRSSILTEMDPNIPLTTPQKRRNRAQELNHDTSRDHEASLVDVDETPKAKVQPTTSLKLRDDAPLFDPARQVKRSHSEDDDDSTSSSRSENSKRSRRSNSPRKEIAARQFARYPITYAVIARLADLPEDVRTLMEPMLDISERVGVLPETSRTREVEAAIGSGVARRDERLFKNVFHNDPCRDMVPALDDVRELAQETLYNEDNGALEATWNCHVHFCAMEMARRCSQYRHQARWCNITQARIEPQFLLSELRDDERVRTRKVDFGLAILLNSQMQKALYQERVQLNQTLYGPIAYRALAISVETKVPGEGAQDAINQAATWAEAHIRQLRRLLNRAGRSNIAIPPLPFLFVHGSEWQLWCFKDQDGSATFYNKGVTFGNTRDVLGVYQVIAGLHSLMEWGIKTWWPWLLANIIQPLLGHDCGVSSAD